MFLFGEELVTDTLDFLSDLLVFSRLVNGAVLGVGDSSRFRTNWDGVLLYPLSILSTSLSGPHSSVGVMRLCRRCLTDEPSCRLPLIKYTTGTTRTGRRVITRIAIPRAITALSSHGALYSVPKTMRRNTSVPGVKYLKVHRNHFWNFEKGMSLKNTRPPNMQRKSDKKRSVP